MTEGISTVVNRVEYSHGIVDTPNRSINFVQHWRTQAIEAHIFVADTGQLLGIVEADNIIVEMESTTEKTNRMKLEFLQNPNVPAPSAKPDCLLSNLPGLQQKQIVQEIATDQRRVSLTNDRTGPNIYETIEKMKLKYIC